MFFLKKYFFGISYLFFLCVLWFIYLGFFSEKFQLFSLLVLIVITLLNCFYFKGTTNFSRKQECFVLCVCWILFLVKIFFEVDIIFLYLGVGFINIITIIFEVINKQKSSNQGTAD